MSINATNTDSGQNSESASKTPFQSALDEKARIVVLLTEAVTELYGNREDINVLLKKISVERIVDSLKGDYATSFALGASKLIGITPIECAMTLVESLHTKADSSIIKIEVAGPGFINFFLEPQTIYDIVSAVGIHQDKTNKYGFLTLNVGKKIAYEYTDPNPFKVFHIGHLMANIIGESLSRLGEYTGAEIKRFCYQGDLGRHVALFVYGLRFMDKPFPTAEEGEKVTLVERMYYMGTSYAKGATYFKKQVEAENKEVEAEVQNINKKLYERSDEEINTIYDLGLEWSLQYFETLYDLLGTKFDQYFFESKCVEPARALIADALKKGIFTESEGAIVFEGEKYEDKEAHDGKGEKLHTRVFITKYGLPTYDAKELGLAKLKYDAFKYDKGIIVTANEQDQYFKVNLKAQSLVLPELTGKNTHVSHGMMILPSGKMSSRTGDVVSAEEMVESARAFVLELMKDREMTDEEKMKTANQVAIAGIKYLVLRQGTGKDVIYDAKKAMSFEGDSGPYLQYTAVRAKAVLRKAQEQHIEAAPITPLLFELLTGQDPLHANATRELIKKIYIFPEIVEKAYIENGPHAIATYLIDLAGTFNACYAHTHIVDTTDESTKIKSAQLVTVTKAVQEVLTNGLYILGIEVPEKM